MALSNEFVQSRREENCLKWAIVGTGYMASIWAELLLLDKIGKLHAVSSRSLSNARAFGRKFGCKHTFVEVDDMLLRIADELDFIYIATPLETHYEISKKCIEAGVNVLTEKPAMAQAGDWLELTQLAKRHRVLLIEGMWMRCLPTFRQAERWIDQGRIGKVEWIKVDLQKFQVPGTKDAPHDIGVMMDFGVYALYFACHFLGGYPDWFECNGRYDQAGRDTDWAIIAGKDNKKAVINVSSNIHATSSAAIVGEKGVIEWSSPFNRTNKVALRCFHPCTTYQFKNFQYRIDGFEYQLAEVTLALKRAQLESRLLPHQKTLDTLRLAESVQEKAKAQTSHRE